MIPRGAAVGSQWLQGVWNSECSVRTGDSTKDQRSLFVCGSRSPKAPHPDYEHRGDSDAPLLVTWGGEPRSAGSSTPRAWEPAADGAGPSEEPWNLLGRPAWPFSCGAEGPREVRTASQGAELLRGTLGFSAGRQDEPLGAPWDLLSTPAAQLAHVYKHPITSDYKPVEQLG